MSAFKLGVACAFTAIASVATANPPQAFSRPAVLAAASVDHGTPLYEDFNVFNGPDVDLTAYEYERPEPTPSAAERHASTLATRSGAVRMIIEDDPNPGGGSSGGYNPKINTANWWSYRIDPGSHTANVIRGSVGERPRHGLNWNSSRTYKFAFDPSAAYVLAPPYMADPADQLDWNKLPGFSDCGNTALSKNGAMFGWRWNIERQVLEITAYWNNDSVHLWPQEPLLTLTRAELASGDPLTYRVSAERNHYAFSIQGTIAGRTINIATTGSRACPGRNRMKWNSALYFGGTSTTPQSVTGRILEER